MKKGKRYAGFPAAKTPHLIGGPGAAKLRAAVLPPFLNVIWFNANCLKLYGLGVLV